MVRDILLKNSNKNRVVISSLQDFQGQQKESPFYSIKYVLKGKEVYNIEGKNYEVSDGEYLVSNYGKNYGIDINSKENVDGLCLFIHQAFMDDVYLNMNKNEGFLLDHPFAQIFGVEIHEAICSPHQNHLGNFLHQLHFDLQCENFLTETDSSEIFYHLSRQLLIHQRGISDHYNKLEVRKKSTAAELFGRLIKAKNMIDNEPEKEWTMAALSRAVALSEFHFFRTFKKAFNISPYQYIIRQRIIKASVLLQKKSCSIAETALLVGFADIYSFSKAFKKYKGVCPSAYQRF